MASEKRVYHTLASTDLRAKVLWDEYRGVAEHKGGTLSISRGFESTEPILVLTLPNGIPPEQVFYSDWEEYIPNEEKTETVGREPNTTDTVG